jgi:hypothetical protein
MNNPSKNESHSPKKNKLIEKALRVGGYSFPQTIDEVSEFERLYGTTDVILPPELQEPFFLYAHFELNPKINASPDQKTAISMAAREGSSILPVEIKSRIIQDIKTEEAKKINSKSNK